MKYRYVILALLIMASIVAIDLGYSIMGAVDRAKRTQEQQLRELDQRIGFIEPGLPGLDSSGLPPITTEALRAYAREGIRAHGPIRRDCRKNRHGFPQAPEVFPERPAMLAGLGFTFVLQMAGEPMLVAPPSATGPEHEHHHYAAPIYISDRYYPGAPTDRTPVSVPEPSPVWLLLAGLGAMLGIGWRRVERDK